MKITGPIRSLLLAVVMLAMSAAASAGVFISVNFGPPALPVYEQPPCPAEGYMWTPGYWAYGPYGYYWVPGTWVLAPQPGYLWTPGYWAWGGGLYYWHAGYWGPVVGFYGGIPYGYGYTGAGYYGGYWRENHFYYNQTVNNVNVTKVTNVYNTTVINNNTTTVNRVSYNGGPGGIVAHATPQEEAAARQPHIEPTAAQVQHENTAKSNPELRASVNQGRPPIAATVKPAEFKGSGVVAASRAGASYSAPENRPVSNVNNVPRPGNNAQPQVERSSPAPRNEVPRPPSASNESPRPETAPREGAAPREGSETRNVPRPPSSYAPGMTSRENAPRDSNVSRPETAPRPQPEREAAPRPENTPRPQAEPPREARPQAEPRQEAPPRPEAQPRQEEPRRENPPR
ncbi:MAG TPA: hypothetical protein VEG68_11495 [Terriglobales bacterium]|nr:hypothetical protein [Terriglobales bacterium]